VANKVVVDVTEIENLAQILTLGKKRGLGALGEAGALLLRTDIKANAYELGNLYQGVAPPLFDFERMRAELSVKARQARTGARPATVHYPSGKTKQITLRPRAAFDYAETVARGRPAIRPKLGKAILIPVLSRPTDEPYITEGNNVYVTRRSAAATKPNPFDERVAVKLEQKGPAIVGRVFEELFN